MPLTLGTAGHIDHGKTALVRALTGVDTDRLPEEQARGISIALGYAPLALPGGRVSVVDVPGHERFVRTMVAGATGIDLYLMVVAADDGVMPQTREHAAVLAALGVSVGVVAITKSDLADPARAAAEAAELLPGAERVPVSSRTGAGLDELRAAVARAAERVATRVSDGPARLHVDRAFTIKGAGTVVTGTLWSGTVARGDHVTVLPADRDARVRGVEVHDEPVERAEAGQRVALNLVLGRDEVARGDVIVVGETLEATYRVDVALTWATPDARPDGGARVAVHHGTRESAARLVELGGRFFQLRLEEPIVPAAGDRLVIRSLAPPDTLGGGVVLDPAPRRHGPSRDLLARLTRLERGEPEPEAPPAEPAPAPQRAPLGPRALALEAALLAAAHEPPPDEDAESLAALREHGRAVRLGPTMHIHVDALAAVRERVVAMDEITLAGLRDELQTSRKYAQALLEAFDREGLTLRRGDVRVLRQRRG
ncbi:selenocysteine-specific translation elongation factor [Solirubrobacter sp. CPCC 204708]|uniref:Selenocysteine-specific elongation factor n=1 Tax=Solirubrobacter deserti TaxID=2282478 RepID=A0ABT4RKM2_9ACTN|nr:selenocysteine-specific translation elongation factor [Solirubrobacter deserti]MBE2317374.1 selenocysteine-specific translation elongation factor [Solirubrobacter deserti]MDA0139103.1 selenocysteine-specific translation elongation factor [Solirubrobacter deserti]